MVCWIHRCWGPTSYMQINPHYCSRVNSIFCLLPFFSTIYIFNWPFCIIPFIRSRHISYICFIFSSVCPKFFNTWIHLDLITQIHFQITLYTSSWVVKLPYSNKIILISLFCPLHPCCHSFYLYISIHIHTHTTHTHIYIAICSWVLCCYLLDL